VGEKVRQGGDKKASPNTEKSAWVRLQLKREKSGGRLKGGESKGRGKNLTHLSNSGGRGRTQRRGIDVAVQRESKKPKEKKKDGGDKEGGKVYPCGP